MLKIVVLAKQVPDTTEILVDKVTGTLIRDGVKSIINPDDLAGLEEALRIKDEYGAHVTVLSMGPNQAKQMLTECYAYGADECILLSDRAFAGSDTWATSNALASALRNIQWDLLIAGRQAIDGDTAQVGPQIAEKLGIPQVTYVEKIEQVKPCGLRVRKAWEGSSEIIDVAFPCLITTLSSMNIPRYMNCEDIWAAFDKEVKIWGFADIDVTEDMVGLKSSPTNVRRTFNKDVSLKSETFSVSPEEAAQKVVDVLVSKQLLA